VTCRALGHRGKPQQRRGLIDLTGVFSAAPRHPVGDPELLACARAASTMRPHEATLVQPLAIEHHGAQSTKALGLILATAVVSVPAAFLPYVDAAVLRLSYLKTGRGCGGRTLVYHALG
jgi:hypothetical protein